NGNAVRREDWSESAVTRTGAGVEQTMSFGDEPANVCFLEDILNAGDVSALGQPDAAGFPAEAAFVMVARNQHLSADGLRKIFEQWQEGMSGGASDDFDQPG